MNFDSNAFLTGAGNFLLYFGMAAAVLIAFKFIYQLVTPYNEMKLIRDGCVPAAITLSAAMIGFAIPVAKSISQADQPAGIPGLAILAGSPADSSPSVVVRRAAGEGSGGSGSSAANCRWRSIWRLGAQSAGRPPQRRT
jgi:putative membrane protein